MVSVLIGILIICSVIILDQVSKLLMTYVIINHGPIKILGNFVVLKLQFNNGAAFSSFSGQFWLLMGITLLATIAFIFMAKYAKFERGKMTYSLGIYFMIGGMFGNFIDRVFATDRSALYQMTAPKHAVCDFIYINGFANCNIADAFLTLGVILVIIDLVFFESRREKDVN